ncbi:MAG: NAD(P)/FAD-dependent oxidoreductase [Proteobacteria bacterium]|nr:NAD(P)/FAD-dependent oxidoreductase [Pseudomonadota bacterium]
MAPQPDTEAVSARKVAVVGGGLAGLTLALRLRRGGHDVTLLEAAPQLGGLASAWRLGPVVWDRHYHVTLLSDSFTRGILRDLDLESEMNWVETKTGFYDGRRLVSLSNALDYLRLPALRLLEKLRLAATILYASRIQNWQSLETIPVETWLTRLSGAGTFRKLWQPLLRAKLGDGYHETSAAFIWATIQRLYAARRTGLKKEMFGYVPGGYARILERFGERLRAEGVHLALGARVKSIRALADATGESRLEVSHEGGGVEVFDRVVLTTTPRVAAAVCEGLTPDERTRLEGVAYQGILCASLLLKRPLADYYLSYLTDPELPFTAVVEMSAFVDRAQFGGHSLVYLPKYTTPDDPLFGESDETVRAQFEAALCRIYPHFDPADVLAFRVSRVREVFPLPVIGYSQRLPAMTTSIPGLHVVSSAHIVNGTLNVNDTVALAERAARSLLASDLREAQS